MGSCLMKIPKLNANVDTDSKCCNDEKCCFQDSCPSSCCIIVIKRTSKQDLQLT